MLLRVKDFQATLIKIRFGVKMYLKFSYQYRCAGNFKNFDFVFLTNKENVEIDTLIDQIKNRLIDQEFFIASKAGVPDLHFDSFDLDLDHGWHEFLSLEECASQNKHKPIMDVQELLIRL